jgi:acyl carrier protein
LRRALVQALELDDTVRSVVAQHLDVRPDALRRDTTLDDLGFDDDTALAVLEAVENLLDVRFPDDFFDGVNTYGELASAVRIAVGA